MQRALEQVVEFLEQSHDQYSHSYAAVIWPDRGPNEFPIVFTEGHYPGWVYATLSFGYEPQDGPSSVPGLRTLRKAVQDKYGGRVAVFCEGREFHIVGRLKSDPKRLKHETQDYIEACQDIFLLLCTAVQLGQWQDGWNTLALRPSLGQA